MSEPHQQPEPEFGRPADEKLTTAVLADAGEAAERRQVESRSFEPQEGDGPDGAAPVFSSDEADHLRRAWDQIQTSFVDEPRRAVEDADHLVASTIKRLAEIFADERAQLESHWDRGDDVSTEDLRVALRRYRAFFGRLLSA